MSFIQPQVLINQSYLFFFYFLVSKNEPKKILQKLSTKLVSFYKVMKFPDYTYMLCITEIVPNTMQKVQILWIITITISQIYISVHVILFQVKIHFLMILILVNLPWESLPYSIMQQLHKKVMKFH